MIVLAGPTASGKTDLSVALAEKIGARLGEKIVVMAPGLAGELGTAAFRVRGIFATESSSFDSAMIFVTLPAAQRMLGLGERVSSVNLRLVDRSQVDAVARQLAPVVASRGLVASTWPELLTRVADATAAEPVTSGKP